MTHENKLSEQNSFDFAPKVKDTLKKVPRKRAERKQLPAYACSSCNDYYKCLNLNKKDFKLRLNKVSRHKGKSPPKTPDHFWELEFPDTEECIKRGYIEAEPQPYYFEYTLKNKHYK